MILKCQKCGHEWIYQGKSKFLASCPVCKSLVNTQQKKDEKSG
jgi:ribosomal protein S27E